MRVDGILRVVRTIVNVRAYESRFNSLHTCRQDTAPWLDRVTLPGYRAHIERVFVIHVEAFDWNCQQHIIPRYTAEEIHAAMAAIEERVTTQSENRILR
jgi:hypothetical protein